MPDSRKLIDAYLDDGLTDEQFVEFVAWISKNPSNMAEFVRASCLHSSMRDLLQSDDIRGLLCDASEKGLPVNTENISDMLEEEAEIAQRVAAEQAHIESLAAEKFAAFQRKQDRRRRPEPVPVPRNALFATVSSLAAAAILCIFWMLPDPVPVEPVPVFVASIDDSIDARWSDPGLSTAPGTQLFTEGKLVLTHGVAQIEFEGGAKMIVEAPATLELLSDDSARLVWGKLVGIVPRSEVELTIKTPNATIVDLGTEFGVEVLPSETTDIQVFQGVVETRPNRPGGKRVRLTAGLTAQFHAHDDPLIGKISGKTSRFVRPAEFVARRAAKPKNIDRISGSEPFVHFDVDFSGGTAGRQPRHVYSDARGVSTMPSSSGGAVLRDGYTDSVTSETIGGDGQLVAELYEPNSSVSYCLSKANVLRDSGVVTIEFELFQDSTCNRNAFFYLKDENLQTIGEVMILSSPEPWRLQQFSPPSVFTKNSIRLGASDSVDSRTGTLVHCIYQLDFDASEQRISLDGGVTFSSAPIPENSSFRQFEVKNATNWERGSIVLGKVHMYPPRVRRKTRTGSARGR
ncbi:MAG: hypothetical protein GXP28_07150 [Planctomycetes bacterium]|nr:hypothetical protein [Planctomycetota bacterium]